MTILGGLEALVYALLLLGFGMFAGIILVWARPVLLDLIDKLWDELGLG